MLELRCHTHLLQIVEDGQVRVRITIRPDQVFGPDRWPPTAAALEAAIERTEDRLMPQLPLPVEPDRIGTRDPRLQALSFQAGNGAQMPLLRDQVENLFVRLANVAHGLPLAQAGLLDDPDQGTLLVVLRELLHHGGIHAVVPLS